MRDPHVTKLEYAISTGEGIEFGQPAPLAFDTQLGHFDLKDLTLAVHPAAHFASTAKARELIEPYLRSWEVETDLTCNVGSIRFVFRHADVVDRNPPPPELGVTIDVGTGEVLIAGEAATLLITQNAYPPAPHSFTVTPEVQLAHARWLAYRAQRESLQSMAYSVLTLVEAMGGGRQGAATAFGVDIEVLREIGRLSSTKGDGATARKLNSLVSLKPLTGAESNWLETAVRRVIQRLGEHAAGNDLPQLTMRDLPPI